MRVTLGFERLKDSVEQTEFIGGFLLDLATNGEFAKSLFKKEIINKEGPIIEKVMFTIDNNGVQLSDHADSLDSACNLYMERFGLPATWEEW